MVVMELRPQSKNRDKYRSTRLCSKESAKPGVFARSARSFA